jgi:hypothetical protein
MRNNLNKDATSFEPPVDVIDDVHGRSDDVVSFDGSIESSVSLEPFASEHQPATPNSVDSASNYANDIPIAARNCKFFFEDESCVFKVSIPA